MPPEFARSVANPCYVVLLESEYSDRQMNLKTPFKVGANPGTRSEIEEYSMALAPNREDASASQMGRDILLLCLKDVERGIPMKRSPL